jgi:hypothetical protein
LIHDVSWFFSAEVEVEGSSRGDVTLPIKAGCLGPVP